VHGVQFFAVFATQHCMLVGICLPWYAISFSTKVWKPLDYAATILAVAGMLVAAHADNTLHHFVSSAQERRRQQILSSGLWGISRHPNHLGEQLWWWGVGLYAVAAGRSWALMGAAFNSLVMIQVPDASS
jgi:steroid 5-alpha reductase family enzyme